MRRRKYNLLDKQSRALKKLGIYLAVVLLIFAIFIPFLGQQIAKQQQAVAKTIATSEAPQTVTVEPMTPATYVSPPTPAVSALPAAKLPKQVVTEQPAVDLKKIIWPLKGEVSQKFGMGYAQTHGDYRFHNGLDIQARLGSEIKTILPGKIITVEKTKSEATVIVVDHGAGWQSTYAQLEDSLVRTGAIVKAGQTIGSVGQPGLSEVLEETHLHFSLTKDGQDVNPLDYLPQ